MNTRKLLAMALALLAAVATLGPAHAAGLLTPADGSLPPLQIRDHHVEVVVEDGYAITTVEQVFHNPHPRDLEAHYAFPVPDRGAVSNMVVWIDGRPVVGEVVEKQRAREIYAAEKAAGRTAGLTEQDGYKTFDVMVSPVRANADTRVRLQYIQPAHVDTGMGRYVYPLEEGGVDEQRLAFWTANETVSGAFSFRLRLRSAYPVDAVRVPHHTAQVTQLGAGEWQVELTRQGAAAGNGDDATPAAGGHPGQASAFDLDQDLVVYWRHQQGLPGSVDLVTHKPEAGGRGTFMLTLTPGDDLARITEGRDWAFVLDISGSMRGGKYSTLAEGVQKALQKLDPNDRFRIITFNETADEITRGYVDATPQNVSTYTAKVAAIQPGGGTNVYAGLEAALDRLDADRTSGLLLVTDGVANVGETQTRSFVELIRRHDARLYTMVMGNSANRPLLTTMTRESGGFAIAVSNADDIVGQLLTAQSKLTHQALHGAELQIRGIRTADLTPAKIGSLYRGQQLIVFGHYWGDGQAEIELGGSISGERKTYRSEFAFPSTATGNPELERLWAFAQIEDLAEQMADYGETADIRQAVTDVAVEYGLVTDYTSMLVVADEVFRQHGIARDNQRRIANEAAAQAQRAQGPIASRRVDTARPMFSAPRASHGSGGGSFDLIAVLMLLPLAWLARRVVPRA